MTKLVVSSDVLNYGHLTAFFFKKAFPPLQISAVNLSIPLLPGKTMSLRFFLFRIKNNFLFKIYHHEIIKQIFIQ